MMRFARSLSVLVLTSGTALGAGHFQGMPADESCNEILYSDVGRSEFLVARASASGAPSNDLMFELSRKGGRRTRLTTLYNDAWGTEETWRTWWFPLSGDVAFALLALPEEAPAEGCRWVLDSDVGSVVGEMGIVEVATVGDGIPIGKDAGIGLAIPGTRDRYAVRSGPLTWTFPERLPDGGVRIGFAPHPEVNPNDSVAGVCDLGGEAYDPAAAPELAGHVIGYNVYRIPACTGVAGGQSDFAAAIVNPLQGAWVGFVDLRTFRLSVPSDGSVSPGPNDLDPGDASELVNPDGRMYSGDEILIFTDRGAASRPDTRRAPRPDQAYWYAVQPVWRGRIDEFANVSFGNAGEFPGDHRRDVDRDGRFDAVDLDLSLIGGVEFLSPQAEPENGGLDGLGLTAAGKPLISKPIFAEAQIPRLFPPECVRLPRFPSRQPLLLRP